MQDVIPPKRRVPSTDRSAEPVYERPDTMAQQAYIARTRIIRDVLPPIAPGVPSEEIEIIETTTVIMQPAVQEPAQENAKEALSEALHQAQDEVLIERKRRINLKRFVAIFLAIVVILATGYVSVDAWLTNNRARAEATVTPPPVVSSGTVTKEAEGKDETNITADVLAGYTVSAELPRAIFINKINVTARVKPMGVNSDNSVQTPTNIFDAGWYNGSVKPGEVGAVFIDGHASGPTRQGLFAYLDKLVEGDAIEIEKGDGSRIAYRVVYTEIIDLKNVDMKKLLNPYEGVTRGLNVMTCTGTWVEPEKTYDKRVVVYTEQV